MPRRLTAAQGVIWHPLSESHWVIVAPQRAPAEKCLLLEHKEVQLLERFTGPSGLSMDELAPDERKVAEKLLAPRFHVLEEAKAPAPVSRHADLALSVFLEYQSARALEGIHDLSLYHEQEISDPFGQFEHVETTVSHLYRDPHPALGGKSYGARFAQVLLEEKAFGGGFQALEIGCGTGIFGLKFLREVKASAFELYKNSRYTFFDASPVLTESQKELNKEHGSIVSFQRGNACTFSFDEGKYSLVICNEMIADLPVIKLKRGEQPKEGLEKEAWDLAERIQLDFSDAPPQFVLNIGALQLITNIWRALAPGGRAYIVEYGSPHAYATARDVTDHTEYTIHFGHLIAAAKHLGMEATLFPLHEFLRFSGDIRVMDEPSHNSLFRHLLPFLGIEAEPTRVYTEQMLRSAYPQVVGKVKNLGFVPLSSLGGIKYPDKFYLLRLVKKNSSSD